MWQDQYCMGAQVLTFGRAALATFNLNLNWKLTGQSVSNCKFKLTLEANQTRHKS